MSTKAPAKPQTDFTEDELEEATKPAQVNASAPTLTEDGVPYCPRHHCRMKQTSGGAKGNPVAYYACPVDGCDEKGKRVKAKPSLIPAEPLRCHRCETHPVMERDAMASKAHYTILKCSVCGHKSAPMPRPEFASRHEDARARPQVDDLGQR